MPVFRPAPERFAEKHEVDDASGCWLWTAGLWPNGYAQFWDGKRHRVAHAFAYELHVGPVPEGLELDHHCNVRRCVNPAHLEAVTHAENKRREVWRRTHCASGHVLDERNTYMYRGRKMCRTCRAARQRESYRRGKARGGGGETSPSAP